MIQHKQDLDYLLISDVDDTLLGDDDALTRFVEGIRRIPGFAVAYASGRSYESIAESIQETALPEPVAIIGRVGTEIRHYPAGGPLSDWPASVATHWSAADVREVLSVEDDLDLQPPPDQSDYKVSYYLHDAPPERLADIRRRLKQRGVEADLIYSSNRDLDVVPAGVNKGTAAAYLAKILSAPKGHVFVSGNSANDAALFNHGFHGIVVHNAHQELKDHAGERGAYLATRGYADGVLEGLQHGLGSKGAS